MRGLRGGGDVVEKIVVIVVDMGNSVDGFEIVCFVINEIFSKNVIR